MDVAHPNGKVDEPAGLQGEGEETIGEYWCCREDEVQPSGEERACVSGQNGEVEDFGEVSVF